MFTCSNHTLRRSHTIYWFLFGNFIGSYSVLLFLLHFCIVCAAVRSKSIDCVRLILEQDSANVNCQNYVNTSALHVAVSGGQHDVVELLLQRGTRADIAEDLNITPVFTAAQHGQTECLKLLLDSLQLSGE